MTAIVNEESSSNSRKHSRNGGCINFQKGRCRFGAKCRFTHSNPGSGVAEMTSDNAAAASSSVRMWKAASGALRPHEARAFMKQDEEDEDSYGGQNKRERRAGITDTLLPSKRALGPLKKLREQERPWTVNK